MQALVNFNITSKLRNIIIETVIGTSYKVRVRLDKMDSIMSNIGLKQIDPLPLTLFYIVLQYQQT